MQNSKEPISQFCWGLKPFAAQLWLQYRSPLSPNLNKTWTQPPLTIAIRCSHYPRRGQLQFTSWKQTHLFSCLLFGGSHLQEAQGESEFRESNWAMICNSRLSVPKSTSSLCEGFLIALPLRFKDLPSLFLCQSQGDYPSPVSTGSTKLSIHFCMHACCSFISSLAGCCCREGSEPTAPSCAII